MNSFTVDVWQNDKRKQNKAQVKSTFLYNESLRNSPFNAVLFPVNMTFGSHNIKTYGYFIVVNTSEVDTIFFF